MEILINDILDNANIEDLKIPFAAVACDLRTGKEVVLRSGNVARAVRASCSIPGIFVPVPDGDNVLVDGGIINGVPVNVARMLGTEAVVAVKLHQGVEPPAHLDNIFVILAQSLDIMQRSQQMEDPDVLLIPEVCRQHISDLSKIKESYLAGREAARKSLPDIRELFVDDEDRRTSSVGE